MESPSIMSIIGHLTESSFLLYIDRARIIDITVLNAMKMTNTKQ